jgi:hypothetical protein
MLALVKKIIFLLALCVINAEAAVSAPTWVFLDQTKPAGTPALIAVDPASDHKRTVFDLYIYGFWMNTKFDPQGQPYTQIDIPGLGYHGVVGSPYLPLFRFNLAVPTQATEIVLTKADPLDVRSFPGVLVWPQPVPVVINEGFTEPEVFVRDPKVYDLWQGFWPGAAAKGGSIASMMRSIPAGKCEVWPCQWDPKTRELRVAAHMRYTYGHDGVLTSFDSITKERANLASQSFLNWSKVDSHFPPNTVYYLADFLVIYPPGYESAVHPFVLQKRARGFRVTQELTSDIGSTCEDFRAAITAWEATVPVHHDAYCLMVGDLPVIPWCMVPTDSVIKPTDDLYASTNGDDLDEEVYLGRLSVDSPEDCANQIHKILTYEDHPDPAFNYAKVLLWAAADDESWSHDDATEIVRTATYSSPPLFLTLYGNDGAVDDDVTNTISAGMGIVSYSGHGSGIATAVWWNAAMDSYNSADVLSLTNPINRAPVVWGITCTNSRILGEDAIAEVWMEQPEHGSVSYYGATFPSWAGQNRETMRLLFEAVFDLGIVTQSHAIEYAEARTTELLYSDYHETGPNAWVYNLLGDPDMQIRRQTPPVYTIVLPDVVPVCATPPCNIAVQVLDNWGQPVPGVLIGLWKPASPIARTSTAVASQSDEVFDNRYTDPNGYAVIPASAMTEGWLYYAADDGSGGAVLDSVAVVVPTGVDSTPTLQTALFPNHPNPFNPRTTIRYQIGSAGLVNLTIYDTSGRRIRTLVNDVQTPRPGGFAVSWDGRNANGNPVSSGVYLYRLVTNEFSDARKMVILK